MPIPPGWDVVRAAQPYRAGCTLRQLAAEFDRDPSVIRRVLVRAGVVMRPARLPKCGPATRELVRLREAGLTYSQIASKVGMTESGVHARFRREGLLHGRVFEPGRGWAGRAVLHQSAPTDVVCARCDEAIATGEGAVRVAGLHATGWAHHDCVPQRTSE